MLRSLFFYLTFPPLTLAVILVGLPLSFFSPDYLHACGRLWGRLLLKLAGVRLTVSGTEHLPEGGPVIYMANHRSQFDIPALYAGIPGQFRWLAKAELFRIPLFGLAMRRSGYIPVNREDRKEALRSMNEAAARITGGTSVAVFPEGTRAKGPDLLPFKKGGFVLALQARVPVVPVALHGTGRILPRGSRRVRGGVLRVEILPAVSTTGFGPGDRDRLQARVRANLAAALEGDPSGAGTGNGGAPGKESS